MESLSQGLERTWLLPSVTPMSLWRLKRRLVLTERRPEGQPGGLLLTPRVGRSDPVFLPKLGES
jgi:hypothetical protein